MWNPISDLKALQENSVEFFLFRVWLLDALKRTLKIFPKRLLSKGIKKRRLKFNPGLALIGLWTTGPWAWKITLLEEKSPLSHQVLQWKGVQKLKWFPCSKMKQAFVRIARNWNGLDKKLRIIHLVADSDPKGLQPMNWATGIRLWSWWPPKTIKPLTPKIWLLILPSSCCTFPCKLVMRTWCWIKIAASTW